MTRACPNERDLINARRMGVPRGVKPQRKAAMAALPERLSYLATGCDSVVRE